MSLRRSASWVVLLLVGAGCVDVASVDSFACLDDRDCPRGRVCCDGFCADTCVPGTGGGQGGDSGVGGGGGQDAGQPDAGDVDGGTDDAGPGDAGFDAGAPDAGPADAGTDAGFDAGCPTRAPTRSTSTSHRASRPARASRSR